MITRRFLVSAVGGMAVLGAAGIGGSLAWCGRQTLAALPMDRLDVALSDIPAAARIGRSYLRSEGDAGVENAFFERPRLLEAMMVECPESRRQAFRASFRDGFRDGDIVTTERWVVSRAECVVAALRVI